MYVPTQDGLLDSWALNFNTLMTALPATYGCTVGEAAAVNVVQVIFHNAYILAVNPATRTEGTVAAKDVAKASMLAVIRPLAVRIKLATGVTDIAKMNIGVGVRDRVPTPVSAPVTTPLLSIVAATPQQHEIRFADSLTPDKRSKPAGASLMLLFVSIGNVPPTVPELSPMRKVVTRQPYYQAFDLADVGKTAYYYGQWCTRTGLVGPISAEASMIIA